MLLQHHRAKRLYLHWIQDVRTDLELQLQKNLADITRRYASYASHILTSIKLKGNSVTDFRSFLLNLTAFQPGCKEQCKLMSGMKAELDAADDVNKYSTYLAVTAQLSLTTKFLRFLLITMALTILRTERYWTILNASRLT